MIILPAIDLIDGRPVRLSQGSYSKVTVYGDDPFAVAKGFEERGATWIHIVDLDAAKSGTPANHEVIAKIARETSLKVETGGGIRNMETLSRLIDDCNVSRCVIGTAAVKDPEFTAEAIERYGSKVAIGVDCRNGMVSTDGWTEDGTMDAVSFSLRMKELGAETIIFTDIARDGMLTGPAFGKTAELVVKTGLNVIASGGISCDEDIFRIKDSGCGGVIVGKAIYEGKVDLARCLQNV